MDRTERGPPELGKLAENASFPHSHKRIFFLVADREEEKQMQCYRCNRSVLLLMFPVAQMVDGWWMVDGRGVDRGWDWWWMVTVQPDGPWVDAR